MIKCDTNRNTAWPSPHHHIRAAVIMAYTPFALLAFRYYGTPEAFVRVAGNPEGLQPHIYYFAVCLLLLGAIPLAIANLFFAMRPDQVGLSVKLPRLAIAFLAIGLPVAVLLGYLCSSDEGFRAQYPLYRELISNRQQLWPYLSAYGLYYLGWEFFFRGFMLFGLRDVLGDQLAILCQTIPSALMHIGKPPAEAFGSIIGGLVLGWAALRFRSLWPGFLWHWCLGASLDLFIVRGN